MKVGSGAWILVQHLDTNLAEMAAAYLFHICQNHAFVDGNKRSAAFSAVLFLSFNGIPDEALPDPVALEEVTVRVASGGMAKGEVVEFFRDNGTIRQG